MDRPDSSDDQHQHACKKHVILFGISGDPPTGTGGHLGIARQLMEHVSALHQEGEQSQDSQPQQEYEIRILPVYRHTFAEKQQRLISYDDRLTMCRLAFAQESLQVQEKDSPKQQQQKIKVTVSNAELKSWERAAQQTGNPSVIVGTAALMEYLDETENVNNNGGGAQSEKTQFSFCLGADSFLSLVDGKWKESERVLELLKGQFIVVNRIYDENDDNDTEKMTRQENERSLLRQRVESVSGATLLPPNPALGTVSSSQVRSWLRQGLAGQELVDRPERISPRVLEYIQEKGLYAPQNEDSTTPWYH